MAIVAKISRSGGQWCVVVPRAEGFAGNSPSLSRLRRGLRKGIAEFFPHLADEEIREVFELPADAQRTLKQIQSASAAAERAQSRALEQRRRGAARLQRKLGISIRDLGTLMGVSSAQAQQLLEDP